MVWRQRKYFLGGGSRPGNFRLYTLDVAARSRELHEDWRNPCHGFSVLFVQETVSRNALSCNASTSCRMPRLTLAIVLRKALQAAALASGDGSCPQEPESKFWPRPCVPPCA